MTRSALALAALASAAVPGLDPVGVSDAAVPGMDFDVAVVTDDENRRWVVRAPRRPAASSVLDVERQLLPLLADRLPVPVPRTAGYATLPEGGRAVVYRYLEGEPLEVSRLRAGPGLAAHLGRVLAALHDIPPDLLEDTGVPAYSADEYRRRRLAEVDRAAGTGAVPTALLGRWEKALEQVAQWRFAATLVHGDLSGEHVLVDGGRVSGIVDWDEARVADPADDLAFVTVGAGPEVVDTVLEAYAQARAEPPDRHLLDRARLAAELALARWLLGGVDADDSAIIDEATQSLQVLADGLDVSQATDGHAGRSTAPSPGRTSPGS
ncbi:MAG TPA: macrolide 2'-phosphotransferase [Actinomycetales bacterium]|nr:macrolide 2'-phosphotransferase [Actinomycetales bacterium]